MEKIHVEGLTFQIGLPLAAKIQVAACNSLHEETENFENSEYFEKTENFENFQNIENFQNFMD